MTPVGVKEYTKDEIDYVRPGSVTQYVIVNPYITGDGREASTIADASKNEKVHFDDTDGVGGSKTTMKSSRISPSDTIVELNDLHVKKGPYGMLRRRRSASGSALLGVVRDLKKKKTLISKNFYIRECFKYVEVTGRNGAVHCGCGRVKTEHPADVVTIRNNDIKWSPEKCTRRLPTDTYGEIEFLEDPSYRKPYIRIEYDTSAVLLLRLMRNYWNLEVPNLVISVTGGARSFHLKPRLKEEFTKGLVKVAVSTGAWVITGGTNAGVMKHVGEAVKNRGSAGKLGRSKLNVIGIASWGVIENSSSLVSKDGNGLHPAEYDVDSAKTGLDYNHSHFLLVDNGTVGNYGTEIELRSRVEETIAKSLKTESYSATGAIGIPVVILCLEGGPNTIKTMLEAIKKGTPAVVIDGSGRAADIVSFAYKHLIYDDKREVSVIDPLYVDELQQQVLEVFGEKDMLSIYNEIQELLKDEKMVSVFRLEDDSGQSDMDLAILRALLKANNASFQMQLKLALAWNRIDVAKSEIFTEDLKMENFKIDWLYESMFAALLDDKFDFVELFLDEGLNLKYFLTLRVLESLYSCIPQGSPVRQLINDIMDVSKQDSFDIDMNVIGIVLEELMGDRYKSRYRTEFCYQRKVNEESVKRCSVANLFIINNQDDSCLSTPHLDLFIWAVLCNRHKLSLLIWERTRDNIACALMASKILKALADSVIEDRELSYMADDLIQNGNYYEKVAVGVLSECHKQNEQLAQTLLVKELPCFGYLTNLDIAVEADNQDFISQSSCQTLLTKLWMGALYINTELWKVLVCIFVPFLINILIKFRDDQEETNAFDSGNRPDFSSKNIFDENKDWINASENASLNNSLIGSINGSDYSLQKELKSNQVHISKPDLEPDSHNILDHFDEHDETADICIRTPRYRVGYFHRIIHFHDSPYVKFSVNVFFYVILLFLYAGILLTSLELTVHPAEYVLQFWVFSLICEELRQLATQEAKAFLGKLEFYLQDPWNIIDLLSLFGFILATIFRYVASHSNDDRYLIAARIIYSTDIVFFIVRLLQIFSVNRNMGPKLVMIKKMLSDLGYFVVILAVFVIGYGVAKQAVLYPNRSTGDAITGALTIPYWQMYGELFLDDVVEDKLNATSGLKLCEQPNADQPCKTDYGKHVAPVYMAIYMLFTNILLLNLLIAIFNYTFEKVQEDSDKVWKFQRYDLIYEYHDRPSLCPPFIIISHIYSIIRYIVQHCRCCGHAPEKGSTIRISLNPQEEEELSLWEFMQAEAYSYRTMIKETESQDVRLKTILSRLNNLSDEVDLIKQGDNEAVPQGGRKEHRPETRQVSRSHKSIHSNNIENRLAKLEYNMEQVLELLIQQSQKQAAILEASQNILSNSSSLITSTSSNQVKSKITTIHTKARLSPYPGTTLQRFKVDDHKVLWEVPLADYNPTKYTAPSVLAAPYWADVDLMELAPRPNIMFNAYDDVHKVNRISYLGTYDVVDGLPRNPYGRTGIIGRGNLGRFGPNHAADPIATRWKRSSSGIVVDKGKRVLEFIAIQRRDNHQWAIPGGMVEPGEHVSETLRKEFTEEALAKLDMTEDKRKQIADRVSYLFRNGVEVYKGYVDDPRNTDNSWMETVACNFHDDSGEIFGEFQLQAGDDAQAVRWQRVSGNIPLFASHVGILEKVAKMHGAAFY